MPSRQGICTVQRCDVSPEGDEESVTMGRKLYVGNLSFQTDESELQNLFSSVGAVDTVTVMRDRATGQARGFAFVEMQTDEEAQRAINELNGQQLGGRTLTVNEARPQAARTG